MRATSLTFLLTDSGRATALTATQILGLTINAAPAIAFTGTVPGAATYNVPYTGSAAASGGAGTLTYSLVAGVLPAELSLNAGSGAITGTPTVVGTYPFSIRAADAYGDSTTNGYTIVVSYPALTVTTAATLPVGYVQGNYSQALTATSGSGTGYVWTVTGGSTLPAGLNLSGAGMLTGRPTAQGSSTFSVTVTDTASNTANETLSLAVDAGVSITTGTALPVGYVQGNYSQTLAATGGTGTGYIWTVTSGSTLPDGLALSAAGMLSGRPTAQSTSTFSITVNDSVQNTASSTFSLTINAGVCITGGNTLSVGGTPTSTGTVTLNTSIRNNLNTVVGPNAYTVTVNSAGQQVSGNISLRGCGNNGNMPAITVSINTSPVRTTTTDINGNYSFGGVPNGLYTLTSSIIGPSSVFFPASQGANVNNSDVNQKNFTAALGYTVSGTANYGGALTGLVYVRLTNNNCGGQPLGISIAAPGAFTIQGVPPGSYTLVASMDTIGFGYPDLADPLGTTANVSVSNANLTGQSVTMTDPAAYTLTTGPTLNSISPTDLGVVINFDPIITTLGNGFRTESPTSYIIQWSTSSSFTSPTSVSIKAGGANGTGVWILNNGQSGLAGTLSNSSVYYFRAQGVAASGNGPWTVYGGATPTGVTIGAPTGGSTITGAVTFSGAVTGPLYVGFFNQSTGIAYSTKITSPVSPQSYTVQVPNGTNYFFFGILDQNNNGIVDPGDISNTKNGSDSTVTVAGSATQNLTMPTTNSTAKVTTQHLQQTVSGVTHTGYSLNLQVRESIKLPVAVQLISGPNVIHPIDIGTCTDCGSVQFDYYISLGVRPTAGDPYVFHVTYSDGSSEDVTGTVSAVLDAFATNLAPTGVGASTTPTFTWTYPANPSNYVYKFSLSDSNYNTIWRIPGDNSKLEGFPSSVTQIVWGTDPTSGSNPPSSSLSHGSTYNWEITTQDSNGNQAQQQVVYQP